MQIATQASSSTFSSSSVALSGGSPPGAPLDGARPGVIGNELPRDVLLEVASRLQRPQDVGALLQSCSSAWMLRSEAHDLLLSKWLRRNSGCADGAPAHPALRGFLVQMPCSRRAAAQLHTLLQPDPVALLWGMRCGMLGAESFLGFSCGALHGAHIWSQVC